MKLLVTFLLLAELALPQAVAPPSQPIPVDQENSRKAKTILDAAIQALGGQAYLNIHDITQEGTEGQSVDQNTVMNAKNEGVTLYIDSNDHLPVKKSFSWRDPTDKERNIEEEIYDNYRPVQNTMTPHTVTRTYNGDTANQRF